MPYIDGVRVSNEEWTERYGSIKKLHTGPGGENPAEAPAIEAETGAPPAKKARSSKSAKAAKAAVADALGVKADDEAVTAIDVSGLDAEAEEEEPE